MTGFLDRIRGLFGAKQEPRPATVFEPLPPVVSEAMDSMRAHIAGLLATHIPGARLLGAPADFSLLQQLLDMQLFSAERADEARALGVCFGDALADQVRGLTWQLVTDEYGTDPTLRYLEYTLQVNAPDMLLKRIERGEEMDLRQMADWLESFLHEQAQEYRRDAAGRKKN
jgi:hypothetical protein